MKILRKRRGFTTNSSSTADWVQPDWIKPVAPPSDYPYSSTNSTTNTAAAPVTNVVISAPRPEPHSKILSGNLVTIGGIVCTITGIFIIERLVRRFMRKGTAQE